MKKSVISVLALLLAVISFGQTNKKPYAYKSAFIEYELSGSTTGNKLFTLMTGVGTAAKQQTQLQKCWDKKPKPTNVQ